MEATMDDAAAAGAAKRAGPSRRMLAVSALAVGAALAGALWIAAPRASEATDNAYTAADTTTVAPRVRGLVAQVLVRDNQAVRAGQPLIRIDPEEFDARVQAARADLGRARADLASARAALVSQQADEGLSAARVVAARTAIASSQAEAGRADLDHRRYDALVAGGAVARSDTDRAAAAAVTARQLAEKARADLGVARESAAVTQARRPTLAAAVQGAQARVEQAQAALDLAWQDRRHAVIVAPIDGVVGNLSARLGDYVQPGSRLLSLVPMGALYVTANFKETQTGRMRAGQPATVMVDALDGARIRGHVESLAPGSGSSFALLPFEPGTGNFTKIVQRVPVRIRLDAGQAAIASLRLGLSVTARVALKE